MLNRLLTTFFGSRNERLLRQLGGIVKKINALEPQMVALSDAELQGKTPEFRQRVANGESLDKLLPEAFAVCREAAKRVLGLRHFDVQLVGGMVLHMGKIAEMRTGDPVTAVADGVVSYSGVRSGYGNVVEIDHGNGYVTRYAHNSRLLVHVGDLVRAGQQVAKAGSTGRSTGAHVHFEVWDHGRVVDPRKFL
jgi:preprotein translocase subunit SecA